MLRGEFRKFVKPIEVILTALRLIVIPAETYPQFVNAEFVQQLEIQRDIFQILTVIIVFT